MRAVRDSPEVWGAAAAGRSAAAPLLMRACDRRRAAAPVVGMIFGPPIGTVLYNIDPTYPFYYGGLVAIVLGIYFQFVNVDENQITDNNKN